ncbi:hypothetical protein [Nocardioides sp.]|uniref:hypothetical protein n=1 Tax=Nocardioides sp. TaxID=35761 RepID=UPI0039E63947
MARPITVYGDAPATIAVTLRADLSARPEPYADGVAVGTRTPDDRRPLSGPTPLVVVSQDGPGYVQNRANTRVPIRVSVWHATDDDAYDLAQLVHALVTTYAGPVVRSVLPGVAPTRAADPDTGEPMAWFTVTANLKPHDL